MANQKELYPIMPQTWHELKDKKDDDAGVVHAVMTILIIVIGLSFVVWNEVDDYLWEKEYQLICDTEGC